MLKSKSKTQCSSSGPIIGWVFGYGSLVNPSQLSELLQRFGIEDDPVICRLVGYQRAWNVAMDNTLVCPGYKRYRDEQQHFPEIYVAFANVAPLTGSQVHGVAFPVNQPLLEELDLRERNYHRVEVENSIDGMASVSVPVWVYQGLEEANERYERGITAGNLFVAQNYRDLVVSAYGERGLDKEFMAEDSFDLSTMALTAVLVPNGPSNTSTAA